MRLGEVGTGFAMEVVIAAPKPPIDGDLYKIAAFLSLPVRQTGREGQIVQHIHAREQLEDGTTVRVDCDHQCNVMVMDDANYAQYRRGGQFHYHGGFFRRLPALIGIPHEGFWNVVLDLGGGRAHIRYDISYLG